MIPKSGNRFSEKIMLKQQAKAKLALAAADRVFGAADKPRDIGAVHQPDQCG
jgi:hypothetical protein